jgi:hypothetical protein
LCGGVFMCAAQKIPDLSRVGVIDADLSRSRRGIAVKGRLWTETNSDCDYQNNRGFEPERSVHHP